MRKFEHVFLALFERRHNNLDAAQPVEQIGAEQPSVDERGKWAIGRRDDSCVDAPAAGAADPFNGEILNRAEELRLRREREFRYFVEKERPAIGVFELAAATAHACCRPFFDAKEFGFDQRFDERGAVDRDKRPLRAAAQSVNLPRDQFLAGPAFALDEDGEIGCRDALDALAQRMHHRTRSDECGSGVAVGLARSVLQLGQSLGVEEQGRQAGRRFEELTGPLIEATVGRHRGLEHQSPRRVRDWNGVGDVVARLDRLAWPQAARRFHLLEPCTLPGVSTRRSRSRIAACRSARPSVSSQSWAISRTTLWTPMRRSTLRAAPIPRDAGFESIWYLRLGCATGNIKRDANVALSGLTCFPHLMGATAICPRMLARVVGSHPGLATVGS